MKEYVRWFFRGVPIGVANLLPGVSGGTIALLLAFYQELIDAVRRFDLPKLAPLAFGSAASIVVGARIVVWLFANHGGETNSVLLGLVFASVWIVMRRTEGGVNLIPLFAAGCLLAYSLSGTSLFLGFFASARLPGLLIAGAMSSSTMLLPGVSGSSLLIMFGLYETMLEAIVKLQWSRLLPFGTGMVLGLLGLSHLISHFFRRHPGGTLALLSGMILGASQPLWVYIDEGSRLGWMILGFAMVAALHYGTARRA